MMTSVLFLGFPLLAVEPAAFKKAPQKTVANQIKEEKILLMPLKNQGVSKALLANTQTLLTASLAKVLGKNLLVFTDAQALLNLKETELSLGCEEECEHNLLEALSVNYFLRSSLGKVGNSVVVTLVLMEKDSSRVLARSSLSARENMLSARISEVVQDVLGKNKEQSHFKLVKGSLSFAVMEFSAAGVPDNVAKSMASILSAEIKKIKGAKVISKEDIQAMLDHEAQKSALGCADDGCLAEIGDALGVDRLVVGSVGKVGDVYVVGLRLINTVDSSVENRVTETFAGPEGQLLRAVVFASRNLFGIQQDTLGSLQISSEHIGAKVFLDGKKIGELPLRPVEKLIGGRHEIRVQKDHYYDFRGEVYVQPDETFNLWIDLERTPNRWYEGWVFWAASAGVGISAIAVVGGVTAGLVSLSLAEQNKEYPLEINVSLPLGIIAGVQP